MRTFSFIAVNYEIPEVNNPKEKIISIKEVIELDMKVHELFVLFSKGRNKLR